MSLSHDASAIASDRDQGASEILRRLLPLLDAARAAGREETRAVCRAILSAQPGMAPLWNACAAALWDFEAPGRFATTRAEMERAPAALARVASAALRDLCLGVERPRFVTLSWSRSVLEALRPVLAERPIEIVCAESRPRGEGRLLAAALAEAGGAVTLVTDAAAASLVPGATAVITGADAVTAEGWVNKVGTRALAAVAELTGVPVAVVATTDKWLGPALAARLRLEDGPVDELGALPSVGVVARNPVFELTPHQSVVSYLTNRGVVPAGDVAMRVSDPPVVVLDNVSS